MAVLSGTELQDDYGIRFARSSHYRYTSHDEERHPILVWQDRAAHTSMYDITTHSKAFPALSPFGFFHFIF